MNIYRSAGEERVEPTTSTPKKSRVGNVGRSGIDGAQETPVDDNKENIGEDSLENYDETLYVFNNCTSWDNVMKWSQKKRNLLIFEILKMCRNKREKYINFFIVLVHFKQILFTWKWQQSTNFWWFL